MNNYYQGILFKDNCDITPNLYSPLQFINGMYQIFLMRNGKSILAKSANLIDWDFTDIELPHGTVLEIDNKYYCSSYKDSRNHCVYSFLVSDDKKGFKEVFEKEEFHGLDISFMYDGIFRAYARMNITPQIRTIGYMESKDFINWTLLKEVFTPDDKDKLIVNPEGRGKEFYCMSVIKTDKGYFGFLTIYDCVTETSYIELAYSINGIDNWQRLNERKLIIKRMNKVVEHYAAASIINEDVYVVTTSSEMFHDHRLRQDKYYFTELYKIPLSDLYEFIIDI